MKKTIWIALSATIIAIIAGISILNDIITHRSSHSLDFLLLFLGVGMICIPWATAYKSKTGCLIFSLFLVIGQLTEILRYDQKNITDLLFLVVYIIFGILLIAWLFRPIRLFWLYIPCIALFAQYTFYYVQAVTFILKHLATMVNGEIGTVYDILRVHGVMDVIPFPTYILYSIVLILSVVLLGNERPIFSKAKIEEDSSPSSFTYLDTYKKNMKK